MAVFSLQGEYNQRETLKVMQVCGSMGHFWQSRKECQAGAVPVGSVDFCESAMKSRPCPDPYPKWTGWQTDKPWLEKNPFISEGWFYKPAWGYKVQESRLFSKEEADGSRLDGIWWLSPVVNFLDEFRYYIANGEVLTSGWYDGPGEEVEVPDFPVKIPEDYCGAVDFGTTVKGEFILVEAHHPYACGHYSDDHEAFANWLIEGWEYMKRLGHVE